MLILLVSVLIYAFFSNAELYHGKADLLIVRAGDIRMNLETSARIDFFSKSSGTSCIVVLQWRLRFLQLFVANNFAL
jgi:hypothetical protein